MSEQSRKVLWLALGVSFFALIVVLAAFFLFSPGKGDAAAPFSIDGKTEARQENPSDYLADAPQDSLTTQTTSAGDIIIVYGNEPSNPEAAQSSSSSPTTIVVSPTTTTLPKPTSTTVAKPAATKPAATAPVAPTATKSAPASGDYWIQAGSFSVKNNAEALKSLFEQKDLPVAIQVKEVDGKSRYNVRVGPYPSRAEASKWLSAAKSVKGAEQSWITQ
ncbi:MAG: SPOR domain-containing protein [Spirochaetia bacterium]|jgi:cell division protein FtsN|nr:SPOR domain-containing protein [Spirochaetia bacterium]